MLAFKDFSNSEVEKHPVSRDQYPVSANAGKGFRRNHLNEKGDFMQLEGIDRISDSPITKKAPCLSPDPLPHLWLQILPLDLIDLQDPLRHFIKIIPKSFQLITAIHHPLLRAVEKIKYPI